VCWDLDPEAIEQGRFLKGGLKNGEDLSTEMDEG
jgi:hypothetical protein